MTMSIQSRDHIDDFLRLGGPNEQKKFNLPKIWWMNIPVMYMKLVHLWQNYIQLSSKFVVPIKSKCFKCSSDNVRMFSPIFRKSTAGQIGDLGVLDLARRQCFEDPWTIVTLTNPKAINRNSQRTQHMDADLWDDICNLHHICRQTLSPLSTFTSFAINLFHLSLPSAKLQTPCSLAPASGTNLKWYKNSIMCNYTFMRSKATK